MRTVRRKIVFHTDAFEDFVNWSIVNKNIFKRIAELLKDIQRNSFEGKGKPEPLKNQFKGWWSRRITDEHRLIYSINEDEDVEILSCKGHYD
jgi:toxin YoeB